MDSEPTKAGFRDFLVHDLKGHWRTLWSPTWKVWKWSTIFLALFFIYLALSGGSVESVADGLLQVLIGVGLAGYVALFVALPFGLTALGWRLFGLGLMLALLLAPISFWLTYDLLDGWMLDLGNSVIVETSGSYVRHGLPSLEGRNPAARIGGAGVFAIVFLPFILIGLLIDALAVVGDPAVLLALGKFIGALLLVFTLSALAAVLTAAPVLLFALLSRIRKRFKQFVSHAQVTQPSQAAGT